MNSSSEFSATSAIISVQPSGLAVLDASLKVRFVNKTLCDMFDCGTEESCVGCLITELLGVGEDLSVALENVLASGEMISGVSFERPDKLGGQHYLVGISKAIMEGGQTNLFFVVSDITAYKKAEEQARYLAYHDTLTGLPNRSLIYDRIDNACALARRGESVVGTMLIDLDRFEQINHSLGSSHGDEVLKQVAARLIGCLRESDTVGRIGSHDFVMVLLSMSAAEDAKVVAKKVLEVLSVPFEIDNTTLHLTASIGIAVVPGDGRDSQELLKNASAALHQAKIGGRNQFCFFQAEMNQHARRNIELESGLYKAAEDLKFELHYQPKINLRSGEICGVEALLRWQHPERGTIQPVDFIPMLEENGLIVAVGRWALHTACSQAMVWRNMGIKPCCVAVNLSAVQFHRQDLCDVVLKVLNETGLEAEFLELEITESIIMKDVDRAVQTLHALKSLGVKLAVDDFGTGHSSLSNLKRFSADVLKIDKSFIRDIPDDADNATITRTIIDLAHNMRMKVIAEGVENTAQLAFLLRNNCDEMQGYYYSEPISAKACTELLKEGRILAFSAD